MDKEVNFLNMAIIPIIRGFFSMEKNGRDRLGLLKNVKKFNIRKKLSQKESLAEKLHQK
jgi:hypothetical protein